MQVKSIIEEDFVNFKLPSMFIASCYCTWKCPLEQGLDVSICQNSELAKSPTSNIPDSVIYEHFVNNQITKAVVIGGLEPMLQFDEVCSLISYFREHGCDAPFVIYTGYYPDEIQQQVDELAKYGNIIVKFGRYMPNCKPHYDDVLGVNLASNNQYAVKIS